MAVGIGFSRHQTGGVVVAPRRHVSVRPFPRIGSDGFPRNAERHEGYQPVRIIVRKDGGLEGRTVFGGFASPRVISVAGRVAQSIRDAGGRSRGRVILDGGRIAGCIRPGCFTAGDVKDGNGGIAAGVRISLRAAAGRISAGRGGQNTRMVFPGYGVPVYDDSFRNDGRSRGLCFYRPSGRSRVFRPLQGFIAPRIGGDVFSGQRGGQERNQLGRAFRICCSLAVAARDCGYPVHAVFPLPAGIGVLRDEGVGGSRVLDQLERGFDDIAKRVIVIKQRSHSIHLLPQKPVVQIKNAPVMNKASVGVRPGDAHHVAPSVCDGLFHQLRFSLRPGKKRGANHAFRGVFRTVEEMPLPRAALFQHGPVRMADSDERRSRRRGDGFRQAVRTVGTRTAPS